MNIQHDFEHRFERFTSFGMSIMLTSAFLSTSPSPFISAASGVNPQSMLNVAADGARAAGVTLPSVVATSEIPTPALKVAPATPHRLTSAEIEVLRRIRQTRGIKGPIMPYLIRGLNLAPEAGNGTADVLSWKTTTANIVFVEPPAVVDGYIIGGICPDGTYTYLIDKQSFRVIKAVFRKAGNAEAEERSGPTLQNEANTLIDLWAVVANSPENLVASNRP